LALVVDDEAPLAALVRSYLEREGFEVEIAGDGETGVRVARERRPDVIVLDLMLPGLDGIEACRQIRAFSDAYILMLTAKAEEVDKIIGLSTGADDYVTKPFSVAELVARVAAILRRAQPARALPERLELPGLVVDFRSRKASLRGARVNLTPREFEILTALSARRGDAVSREELLAVIWGLADDVEVSTRTVDQHVVALRRKLGDNAAEPRIIETVYGHGYRLAAAEGTGSRS
jgi:DNA-binding response OmpR family regulator